jgi:hypothetical protein
VNRRRVRRPKVSIVKSAGKAKTKLEKAVRISAARYMDDWNGSRQLT